MYLNYPKGMKSRLNLKYSLGLECGGVYESGNSGEESGHSVHSEMSGVERFE